jgi:hypothetical protein
MQSQTHEQLRDKEIYLSWKYYFSWTSPPQPVSNLAEEILPRTSWSFHQPVLHAKLRVYWIISNPWRHSEKRLNSVMAELLPRRPTLLSFREQLGIIS